MNTKTLAAVALTALVTAVPSQQTTTYGHVPLAFERNTGAHPADVRFLSRGADLVLFLTEAGQVLRVADTAVTAVFTGATPSRLHGERLLPGVVNYYRGTGDWHTAVPRYARVRYERAWPGIDVLFHGDRGLLEYDFLVAPGADPGAISISFSGARHLEIDGAGDLLLHTDSGIVRHGAPVAWQNDAARTPVAAAWVLAGAVARLDLGDRDPSVGLVVDPTIVYATHLGGTGADEASRIEVDTQGCAHIVGNTGSANFPTQSAFQPAIAGGAQDLFVTKLSADGSTLLWSTYLGGEFAESDESDIALLDDGSVAVTGRTGSLQFPVTTNAFQPLKGTSIDAFLTILGPTGALTYSTYYGGNSVDTGRAVAAHGNTVYITGVSGSTNLASVGNGFQPIPQGGQGSTAPDAFVAAFDRATGACTAATFLGGATHNELPIGLDAGPTGVAVFGQTKSTDFPTSGAFQPGLAGGTTDSFVALLSHGLSTLHYGSYLGGTGNESLNGLPRTNGNVRIAGNGNIYVASDTNSDDLPVTAGALQAARAGGLDAYLACVDPTQTAAASLLWCTYFGGSGLDYAEDLRVDGSGNVYFCGSTRSNDLPTLHSLAPLHTDDAYVAMIAGAGSALRFCTSFGGTSQTARAIGIALGPDHGVFVTGLTSGLPGLPTTAGAFQENRQGQTDAWVARFRVPIATSVNYGAGHPGTSGVPTIASSAAPILGTTPDILIGSSLGAPTLGALSLGGPDTVLPTPFGGSILLVPFATVTMSIPAAGAQVPLAIPADPSYCGLPFFLQAAMLDAGASHGVSFTPGLRLDLGI